MECTRIGRGRACPAACGHWPAPSPRPGGSPARRVSVRHAGWSWGWIARQPRRCTGSSARGSADRAWQKSTRRGSGYSTVARMITTTTASTNDTPTLPQGDSDAQKSNISSHPCRVIPPGAASETGPRDPLGRRRGRLHPPAAPGIPGPPFCSKCSAPGHRERARLPCYLAGREAAKLRPSSSQRASSCSLSSFS